VNSFAVSVLAALALWLKMDTEEPLAEFPEREEFPVFFA